MFGELGMPELLVILAIALLIFGPKKIGGLGKGLGEGIRNFRNAMRGDEEKTRERLTNQELTSPEGAANDDGATPTANVPH